MTDATSTTHATPATLSDASPRGLAPREEARRAGGDLLLAAPQEQVLRFLTLTGLAGVFLVLASVEEAAASSGRSLRAAMPVT
jgi:hypothetical protein